MVLHCRQQIHSSDDIRLPIKFRLFRGLADQRFACKVQHAGDLISAEGFLEISGLADIAFERRRILHERSMSGGKVIENDRVKACCFEGLYSVTANLAGAASDENHPTASFRK
jgi:hypothetical protein